MSTECGNFEIDDYQKAKLMVPLIYVYRLTWDQSLGVKLKELRISRKISRRGLAENLRASGVDCSHQNIQKIEEADVVSVEPSLLIAICNELNISPGHVIPGMMRVENL